VVLAATPSQALALIEQHTPDAVILDLDLPDMGGMQVLSRIRSWSTVPVIALSARAAEIRKVAALDAGADDYVTKPFDAEELMARLRVALRDRWHAPDVPAVVTEHFTIDLAAGRVTRAGCPVRLTRTEWQIIVLLARYPGCLVTYRQLLAEVWGRTDGVSSEYVRVFMVGIRRKLEPDPAHPRYFITEPGCGVLFLPGPSPPDAPAPSAPSDPNGGKTTLTASPSGKTVNHSDHAAAAHGPVRPRNTPQRVATVGYGSSPTVRNPTSPSWPDEPRTPITAVSQRFRRVQSAPYRLAISLSERILPSRLRKNLCRFADSPI
jgi:two-component system, OmpR family, KDP operon response regulator KdpE